jgi:hypothetical protein
MKGSFATWSWLFPLEKGFDLSRIMAPGMIPQPESSPKEREGGRTAKKGDATQGRLRNTEDDGI